MEPAVHDIAVTKTPDGRLPTNDQAVAAARRQLEQVVLASEKDPALGQNTGKDGAVIAANFGPRSNETAAEFRMGFGPDVQRTEASRLEAQIATALNARQADASESVSVGELLGQDSVRDIGQNLAFKLGRVIPAERVARMSVRELARHMELALPPDLEARLPPEDEENSLEAAA